MKLRALIERLEALEADLHEELGDDCEPEIVCATQPSWPLSGEVLGACVLQEDEDGEPILTDGHPVVWLAVGSHPHNMSPYASRRVFTEAE